MIPKIIFQTHNYRYEDLPFTLLKATETWKNLNPGWEYRYFDWDDREDFIKSEAPELLDLYLKITPKHQSDIWRMLVIHKFGGVYADMDSICTKPLDYMLSDINVVDMISEPRYPDGKVNTAMFAAVKGSWTMGRIVNSLKNDRVTDFHWHTWMTYNKYVTDHKLGLFTAGMHSKDFETKFFDFDVDYYGDTVKYSEYLKNELGVEDDYFK